MNIDIHYLSATVVNAPEGQRHLAFCKALLVYGVDAERYQVANYGNPTRVTCRPCLDAYAATYPDRMAELLATSPIGSHYERMESEDARVHELRIAQASAQRAQVAAWISNPIVSDLDFMYWLHKVTYEDARELLAYSFKIEKGEL